MKAVLFIIYIAFFSLITSGQVTYNDFFTNESLRIDFILAGNSDEINLYWKKVKMENHWSGSRINLIDSLNRGSYIYELRDLDSKKLIYSSGFSSLFEEWQYTKEAKHTNKYFEESINLPYLKKESILKIYARNMDNSLYLLADTILNPASYLIDKEVIKKINFQSIVRNGSPNDKIDIAFLAEGYTIDEMEKFKNDVNRLKNYMFNTYPFNKYKNRFNIWLINLISEDSGTDNPRNNIWKSTALNTSFYTFNSERYLTSTDFFKIKDYASVVPYDYIVILVNTAKYGGGGIYNHFCVTVSDNEYSNFLFIHEFGHSFCGLADEYYTSKVAFADLYEKPTEPWEPNITTLIDFDSKWKEMIESGIPVPTPLTKQYKNVVGVFEGGGYAEKGIYRPYLNCIMKSKKAKNFCPVCAKNIEIKILNESR
ncbi:M64 family metallopeptidase [Bacteroidota bacterium]